MDLCLLLVLSQALFGVCCSPHMVQVLPFLNNDKFQGRVRRAEKEGWRNLLVAISFYDEK